jgi:hypothetical protein
VLCSRAADRLRAADGDDVDAVCRQVATELRRDRLERDPIGDPFDEYDGQTRKLA